MPFYNLTETNIVDYKEYDLDYRNVIEIIYLIDRYKKDKKSKTLERAMNIFGFDDPNYFTEFVNWLLKPRWKTRTWIDLLTEEEKKGPEVMAAIEKENQINKIFDYALDFDAYYSDFKRYYNIDLIDERVEWFKFNWLLSSLFEYKDSSISKRLSYRSYEKQKGESPKYSKAMMDLKNKYSLGIEINEVRGCRK